MKVFKVGSVFRIGLVMIGLAVVASGALAQDPAQRAPALAGTRDAAVIAERQETMRQMEGIWMLLEDMILRLEPQPGPQLLPEGAEGAEILAALFADMRRQYPEGTFAPPSEALPEVRDQWGHFLTLVDESEARALALRDALLGNDITAARLDLDALGKACSACHLRYSPGIRSDQRLMPPELR